MKKELFLDVCLLMLIVIPAFQCHKKNSNPINPADQLPAPTSSGKNTFGCLINGKVMIPRRPFGDIVPYLTCTYQYLYNDPISGYALSVSGTDKADACHFNSVTLSLDSADLQVKTYPLGKHVRKGYYANTNAINGCQGPGLQFYYTTEIVNGELSISFLDRTNQIVSGVFWFDAVLDGGVPGDTMHVREGRFDMHYTQ